MITAIILEDEKNVNSVMRRMLESHHKDIHVAAVCYNIKEAEEMLLKHHPNLVFLDVELGKSQTCFDLLKKISPIDFDIIFTTGYNRYAMQAIKLSTIDYLLKPIDGMELKKVIEKFKHKKLKTNAAQIESLLGAWGNPGNQENKMPLPTPNGCELVTIADIIFCESIDGQTLLVLKHNKELLISMSLKEFENLLTPYRFYRIHKSYLINLNHVKKYINGKESTAVMSNDTSLSVSRSIVDKFTRKLKINQPFKSI